MHAYIISGAPGDSYAVEIERLMGTWNASPHDAITITREEDKKDISILQIRSLTKQLQLSPIHGEYTVAVVQDAHTMTIAAQNALLKTLEEPPKHAKIILTTSFPDTLLETIRSRCEYISVHTNHSSVNGKNEPPILTFTLTYCMALTSGPMYGTLKEVDSRVSDRESAIAYIDALCQTIHQSIKSGQTKDFGPNRCAKFGKILLETRVILDANVNPKLAVDNAFLEARQSK